MSAEAITLVAAPLRRQVWDLVDKMPRHLQANVCRIANCFPEFPRIRALFGSQTSTVTSQFLRAGYASPKAMQDALRLALAITLRREAQACQGVAFDLGYGDVSSFRRAMRRLSGGPARMITNLDADAILRAGFAPITQGVLEGVS